MRKTEITFVKDMYSPKIGTKLWSDITFVNFKARRFINESPENVQEIDILSENGYCAIDSAIADTIMRLNSMEGCKTRYCCSGHPGRYCGGYILFEKIPEKLSKQLSMLKYWKQGASPKENPHLIQWALHGVPDTDTATWLRAMLELAELECLPKDNPFDEYRINSTYKGRSPRKQEIRHINPVNKYRNAPQKAGLILLAARPGVGIKTFARSVAAGSIIDATGLNVSEVTSNVNQLEREGKDPIVIDDLQAIMWGKEENRTDALKAILRILKTQTKIQRITTIVLAQLGRMVPGKTYQRPQLSDLRELGDITPVVDTIWLLDRKFTRTHREGDRHSAELVVIHPKDGTEKVFPMTFDPERKRFCLPLDICANKDALLR